MSHGHLVFWAILGCGMAIGCIMTGLVATFVVMRAEHFHEEDPSSDPGGVPRGVPAEHEGITFPSLGWTKPRR